MTTNPNPGSKPLSELTPGEHIGTALDISRVAHVQPYRDGDGRPQVAVTLTPIDGGKPWVRWGAPDDTVQVATEAEVAAYAEFGRRAALATALRELADDIVEYPLPVPQYSVSVGGALESRAELEVWARYLGVDITPGGTAGDIPVADKDIETPGGPGLNVHLQSPSEPKPEPAAQEHIQASGWHGGPGQCGAVCTCGTTFAGCDSIAEADALLDDHIAQATTTTTIPPQRSGE
jgi:hypothetical protein